MVDRQAPTALLSGAVLRLLATDPARLHDLIERIGVSADEVAERVQELVDARLVDRRGDEHSLTDKGRALLPAATALEAWADRWLERR